MIADNVLLRISDILVAHRCGDSSCIYGRGTGQMTNGGCAHLKGDVIETRRELQKVIAEIVVAFVDGARSAQAEELNDLRDEAQLLLAITLAGRGGHIQEARNAVDALDRLKDRRGLKLTPKASEKDLPEQDRFAKLKLE